jgi:hypothetical protein
VADYGYIVIDITDKGYFFFTDFVKVACSNFRYFVIPRISISCVRNKFKLLVAAPAEMKASSQCFHIKLSF